MDKQYAVWSGHFIDNDSADWHTDHETAYDAWHQAGAALTEGESAYMQRFEDGDVDEDYPHELRREDGELREYYGGERMWM